MLSMSMDINIVITIQVKDYLVKITGMADFDRNGYNMIKTTTASRLYIWHPTVMGTWWMRIVTEWLKLPAYLYDVCAAFLKGDEIARVVCVLYNGK